MNGWTGALPNFVLAALLPLTDTPDDLVGSELIHRFYTDEETAWRWERRALCFASRLRLVGDYRDGLGTDQLWSNYDVPLYMLARFGAASDIPRLIELSRHESAEVRGMAVWALGQINPREPRALAAIQAASSDPDRRVQLQAGVILAGLKGLE